MFNTKMLNNKLQHKVVITLDGPAGVGKSTLAQSLADTLEIPVLDTGAMFRYIGYYLGPAGLSLKSANLKAKLAQLNFSLSYTQGQSVVLCNNEDLGDKIRSEEMGFLASKYAIIGTVRSFLKKIQQNMGQELSFVAEGRDMGTVIFPEAFCKFFIDATPKVRAERRYKQLLAKGMQADLKLIEEQIVERDEQDRNRVIAPLKPAKNAVIIDGSDKNIEEILELMLATLKNKGLDISKP